MRNIQRLVSCCRGVTRAHIARWFCLVVAAVAVIEFLILNIIILYVYRTVNSELSQISSTRSSDSFLDKLQNNKKINSLLSDAKTKGWFVSLLQETVERLYIVRGSSVQGKVLRDMKNRQMSVIDFIGVDVSHSREATYIYNRIQSRTDFPYHFMVVDIGANDGFISSNSFNFIQWGWDAVLVEPQPLELHVAEENVKKYVDRYNDGVQSVKFVQSVIGDKDGSIDFVMTKASQGTESHVLEGHSIKDGDVVVQMPCMTVATLARENNIPKNFGILSIDAEGAGAAILKQWISQDFRPAYIIFEHIHKQEPLRVTIDYLKTFDYHYKGTLGWNVIFEHFDD